MSKFRRFTTEQHLEMLDGQILQQEQNLALQESNLARIEGLPLELREPDHDQQVGQIVRTTRQIESGIATTEAEAAKLNGHAE